MLRASFSLVQKLIPISQRYSGAKELAFTNLTSRQVSTQNSFEALDLSIFRIEFRIH